MPSTQAAEQAQSTVPEQAAGGEQQGVAAPEAADGRTLPGAVAPDTAPPDTAKAKMLQHFSALKPFVIISSSYLLYTITDGAIRMIVLLQAYNLGFSAWQVALMFTAYELAGVFTNLAAGVMGE